MTFDGNRYRTEQPIQTMMNGMLARGTDLTLGREVLLYTYQETDELAHHEALRWLAKACRISGAHLMRMVEAGAEAGHIIVVLQAETGSPLQERLIDLDITGRKALEYVRELAKGIRESRRNRLPECSVDAGNLWLDHSGRMRILNYWSEGKHGRRGVPGLALLLYQLGARTDIPTSSLSAYAFEMNRLFADMPVETRERAVTLACRAYEGECTLADFQAELEALLGSREVKKPESVVAAPEGKRPEPAPQPQPQPRARTAAASKKAADRSALRLRSRQLLAGAGFCALIVLLWLTLRPGPASVSGGNPQPSLSANRVPASQLPAATAAPSAAQSAAPTAAPPANPTSQPAAVQTDAPPTDGGDQVQAGVVPDLIAHTREDAERMAKAAGLRYQFFLEANAAAKGIVFKQDLTPGAAVRQGDRITFWVSKGS
ncbi:PASTA domain-containing protein [Bacillus sp. 3255]|uniref:PASTA domain-containing protein n=1 Tax=Bacillus sp. 3255 TaxID=2817904 RepID=UPI00285B3A5F|nr:PASTA domain-containing protein [Bacillus sp. 3255]MDR6880566.1 hypothetical protein [Bacillus sp. 3255]